jgi:hypothetical protein
MKQLRCQTGRQTRGRSFWLPLVRNMGQPGEGSLPLLTDARGVLLGEGFEGPNLLLLG